MINFINWMWLHWKHGRILRKLAERAEAGILTVGDVIQLPCGLAIIDIPSPRLYAWYKDFASNPSPFVEIELHDAAKLMKQIRCEDLTPPDSIDMLVLFSQQIPHAAHARRFER